MPETLRLRRTSSKRLLPASGGSRRPRHPSSRATGYGTAPVVLFPLSPSRLLVMLRPDLPPESRHDLDHIEVTEVNRELLANTTRCAFDRPSRQLVTQMPVPGPAPSLVTEHVSGSREEGRVALRQHRPPAGSPRLRHRGR